MDIEELVRNIATTIHATATAKNVYGEPVIAGERTVIPVAKIRAAFGGGGGAGRNGDEPKHAGGGGGGRVWAVPCGVVEISPQGTRFVPYREPLKLALAVACGFLLGAAVARLRRG